MTKVLSLRFEAMYNCFKGNFVVALKKLQEALKEAVQNREFPVWFTLDIALDLRNVYVSIAEIPNVYDYGNEGQKYLNDSRGVLYYPTLDREVASFKSDLLKYYAKIKFATPYTTFLGNNIALIFKSIAQAYAIAMFNGSITHVNMTKKHIMETIYILSSMEVDHDLRMELVRICIIERDVDKLDVIEQSFPSGLEHLSSTDAEEIYNSLEKISSDGNAMISKFITLSYLGNHLSDTSFSNYTEELLSFTSKWIEDEKKDFFVR